MFEQAAGITMAVGLAEELLAQADFGNVAPYSALQFVIFLC